MKIAFLNIYNGKVERGAEVFVSAMEKELSSSHKVDIFQTRSLPVVSHTTLFYHFLVFIFSLRVFPKLHAGKYDWIIPVNGGLQALLVRIIRYFTKSKILISGHAGVGKDDLWNIVFGNPDIFVALSPYAASWAKKLRNGKKVEYIPNGIDTDLFIPQGPKYPLHMSHPIILCVSALDTYKRIDRLIYAVSFLPKANLVLVGNGPRKKELIAQGKKLLGTRFIYIEHLSHSELPSLYRSASVFSLPSRESEAFGLVYLEALACNIPVVAPDDENRRAIIGKAGLYADPENKKEYARVLQQAISYDFRTKPRKQAEKFSWSKIAKKYNKVMISSQ
ncbi:glycosyltransferase family 4 protein [Candidatus Gottesmanbacteria bacterium]|nr:glycosyltransferase family 4 protein [Candidatus Gottesmanbacteria bacterium]